MVREIIGGGGEFVIRRAAQEGVSRYRVEF